MFTLTFAPQASGAASGSLWSVHQRKIPFLNAATIYIDNLVQGGTTYHYVSASVNSDSTESVLLKPATSCDSQPLNTVSLRVAGNLRFDIQVASQRPSY